MTDAAYWNRLADQLEKEADHFSQLATEHLTVDWAAEPFDDAEVGGRHAARFAIMEIALRRRQRAGEVRRKAFDLVAPKVEEPA